MSKYYNEAGFATLEEEVMSTCSTNEFVYLTGDFSAQTAILSDFISSARSLDKYLDFDQQIIDFFDQEYTLHKHKLLLDRISKDKKTNNAGFKLVRYAKKHKHFIINGRLVLQKA